MSSKDAAFMAKALQLAERGRFTTDPNPRVGCVLVKDGRIIAEGWHVQAGQAHAEIDALSKVGKWQGATAYVTLEPCSHTGKTGPCCEALIAAGVARVVIAMQDPNPLVSGLGIKKMQQAGITVECGMLQPQAEVLNQGFVKRMTSGLPFVRSKVGMSLDGRTAMSTGESQWITSTQARADVQFLRAESSVVLTGVNTVLADDPSLNVRLAGMEQEVIQPIRVILDSNLQTPADAKMLGLSGQSWILTISEKVKKITALEKVGFQVFQVNKKDKRIDLESALFFLGQQQINTVLVEAGAILNGALLDLNLVDEWVVYMAPCILGDQGRGVFHLPAMQKMSDKKQLNLASVRQVGPDIKLVLNRNKN